MLHIDSRWSLPVAPISGLQLDPFLDFSWTPKSPCLVTCMDWSVMRWEVFTWRPFCGRRCSPFWLLPSPCIADPSALRLGFFGCRSACTSPSVTPPFPPPPSERRCRVFIAWVLTRSSIPLPFIRQGGGGHRVLGYCGC